MNFIYKHRNKLIIIASILLILPFIFNIGLLYDDPFSMGMINHTYPEIVKLTTMDVHPPLYYFVLKAFLSITTFWTSNIFIKILFARLLSVIFALISLIYIIKILHLFEININKYVITFLFVILPVNFGLDQQAAHIRMYSMSTALTIMVVYYLILFLKSHKRNNLLMVSIFSTLALYTNYYFGLIAGLYILSAIVYEIYQKKYKVVFQLMISGIIALILFIPWIHNLLLQINVSNSNSVQSFTTTSKVAIVEYFAFIIVILASFFINKNMPKELLYFSYSNVFISIIVFILNIIMYPVSVSLRYTSTPLILLMVLSIFLKSTTKTRKLSIKNSIKIILLLLIAITFAKSIRGEIKQYNIPSISFINKFNKIQLSRTNQINGKKYDINNYTWKNQGGNSIYLLSINKKISDKHYTNVYYSVGNGNVKLFKAIFPNVEHYYSQKN